MSDPQSSPLQAARQRIAGLRQQPGADLTSALDELDRLLAEAEQRGEGQDAAALREAQEALIQTTAQFVSVMVHEIRVPMTSIRGYSDMLAKGIAGPLNEMQQQFTETIRSNVIRMEHLVSDISDISKIQSGRIRLDPKMDVYKSVAQEVEKNTRDLAAQHNHTLTFETPDHLPLLNLDTTRLVHVISKLVVNALQYTPDGGTITVRAEDQEGRLKVSVIDSGIGMSEEEQTHLGELFWRADSDLVRSFKGHGLGLPIAMGLVKLMGGEFFARSAPSQGSTFGFSLPTGSVS